MALARHGVSYHRMTTGSGVAESAGAGLKLPKVAECPAIWVT
jgi:hypothetical protein